MFTARFWIISMLICIPINIFVLWVDHTKIVSWVPLALCSISLALWWNEDPWFKGLGGRVKSFFVEDVEDNDEYYE